MSLVVPTPTPDARRVILAAAGSLDGVIECWHVLNEPRGETVEQRLQQVVAASSHPTLVECVLRGWLVTTAALGRDPETFWQGTVDSLLPAGVFVPERASWQ